MPFEIVRNDITKMAVDAIVNTVNPRPVIGAGVDAAIHKKAGPQLLRARQAVGSIPMGSAAITPAYGLDARYVIHTVGPVWIDGSHGEDALLRSCYDNALSLALENQCESIAFPLISTGNYGFPKDKALQIAIAAFSTFLLEHELRICLVVFDGASFRLSEKLFQRVASYIDENYVRDYAPVTFEAARMRRPSKPQRRQLEQACESRPAAEDMLPCAPVAADWCISLEDMLKKADAGFTERLLQLIDESGRKDADIYKKAGISKQHFSKIRNDPHYKPKKPTAVALALALELDLEQTRDLLARAGYALSNSSKFDLIVRYFIEQRNYNVVEINCVLFEHDQSLLGA